MWDTDRRATLPPDWQAIRRATATAAGGRCQCSDTHRDPAAQAQAGHAPGQRCTAAGTDCDHTGNRYDHTRTQWLCGTCHLDKTLRDNSTRRNRGRRTPPRHPGLTD